MRVKFFPLLVVVLVCSAAAAAQSVIESDSTADFDQRSFRFSLAVDSGAGDAGVPVRLDLLDTAGNVVGSTTDSVSLAPGRNSISLHVPVDAEKLRAQDNVAWYRLKYRVGAAEGLISLSQMLKDLFELRIIASDSVLSGMNYRVRVRASNPFTDTPASGVNVKADVKLEVSGESQREVLYSANSVTDAEGFAVLDFAIPNNLTLEGDGEVKVVGERNGIVREASEDLDAPHGDVQFLMTTDKPIYQPGQSLSIRGILLKGMETKTVLTGKTLEFRVTDEDDTVLFRQNVEVSEYGIAAVIWNIPANARLGNYRVEVRDDDDQIGGRRVKISRYDLPNFVVQATPSQPYYLPRDKQAEVEVRADYLFGKPVTKGKVRVVEETSREWNWKEQKYDIEEGQVRTGETDAEGKFLAKFDLKDAQDKLKDDDWRKYRDIEFAAYFTDPTTNRTEQRRFDIRVTREPIHVYLIGETNNLNPQLPIEAYVSTFYADGSPAECDVEVKAGIDDKKSARTVAKVKTNAYGAGRLMIDRPNIGDTDDDLDFALIARDKRGNRGRYAHEISFDVDEAIHIRTDKAIYKPGDMVHASIVSSIKSGTVYVDVVKGWSAIDSRFTQLEDGKAEIAIPYQNGFKGQMTIAAFVEDDDEVVRASRGILFPTPQGLKLTASFDKSLYKPNEEATVNLGVVDEAGRPTESALGLTVIDKAVEARAKTDADFGGMWSDFSGSLGYGDSFGGINVKDLNDLDLSKPISDDMQLVADVILHNAYYHPNIFHSAAYNEEAKSVFGDAIGKQFNKVAGPLMWTYRGNDHRHPTNEAELRSILLPYSIDPNTLVDPWGQRYRVEFTVEKEKDVLSFKTAGPDKKLGTDDDFTAFTTGFEYFKNDGSRIDDAVQAYHRRTGKFARDGKTLLAELGVDRLNDRFGRPYRFEFEADGRYLVTRVRSGGPDGKFDAHTWRSDDFYVWTNKVDYFADLAAKINAAITSPQSIAKNLDEFRSILRSRGLDADRLRDGWGRPLYINVLQRSRYWDKITIETYQEYGKPTAAERRVVTPVTQDVIEFTIRSAGADGTQGTWDDFTISQTTYILSERSRNAPTSGPAIKPVKYSGSTGSIAGVVKDPQGAAVGGATVAARNESTKVTRSTTSGTAGDYLIPNLAPGNYTVTVTMTGFQSYLVEGVSVNANSTSQVDAVLSVGTTNAEVTVASDSVTIDTTESKLQTNVTQQLITALPKGTTFSALLKAKPADKTTRAETDETQANSTPRVREYFPETLYWQPEIITDANGQASVKFKMADNITTWKMYTIASTKEGKVGIAENEVTAFQSFFMDLDPPKFLTTGDEIWLPTQVRNYTDQKQKVDVTMDKADWFTLMGDDRQQVDVATDSSQNAVFGFRAAAPVTGGKQRVTAIAQSDSDAIEKPVTVRPNGEEVVKTDSQVFRGSAEFDVDFPTNALPNTQKAEIKIYPNLFSHVAESVEGLLERPYGCGEQTISSTYPNLMILKFIKTDSPLRQKAAKYLQKGYERLLGYQVADGGFTYWGGKDTSDVALTAYALRFLNDAKEFIDVDEDVIKRAEDWLVRQQRADGSWTKQYGWERGEDAVRTKMITTYVARSLSMRPGADKNALQKALGYLKQRNAEIDEPYALALFGLASLDAGDTATAKLIAGKLENMAITEGSTAYWKLETNTPFYGWGAAGRIETTALVVQLLTKVAGLENRPSGDAAGKGLLFMLKNKDRYGVWYSTQTTINVLDSFLAVLASDGPTQAQALRVSVNGTDLPEISISADRIEPVIVDLAGKLSPTSNKIAVRGSANSPLMAQAVATHYVDWRDSQSTNLDVGHSRALRLDYKCDKQTPAVMEDVTCSVDAERIGFSGYGMLLAEIGTPPGADVSRESLEAAMQSDWSLSRYDVLPDRIVLYMWSKAGGTKFNFKFKPRYGINAQTPASIVYDYYNPEAHATVAPLRFAAR